MSKENLGNATLLDSMQSTDDIFVETGGSVRRVTLAELINAITEESGGGLLSTYERLMLDNIRLTSGVNLFEYADFSQQWQTFYTGWSIVEDVLDGVSGVYTDGEVSGSSIDVAQDVSLLPETWYTLSFWNKGASISVYITGCTDTSTRGYLDGASVSVASDGNRAISAADEWTKHIYTFKTKTEISSARVYFRAFQSRGDVWIALPKIERGMIATSFSLKI